MHTADGSCVVVVQCRTSSPRWDSTVSTSPRPELKDSTGWLSSRRLLHLSARPLANFPIPGITFIDFLPLLRTPGDFEMLLTHFMNHIYNVTMPAAGITKIDVVVGLDARGFLLGSVHTVLAR